MNPMQLRLAIREEIGPDAYSRYNGERYAISELVLRMLVEACLIEFLKGIFDFESLGHGVRAQVDEFVREFKKGQEFVTLDLGANIDKALRSTKCLEPASQAVARKNLTDLLVNYGMDPEIAQEHAGAIEKSILSAIPK